MSPVPSPFDRPGRRTAPAVLAGTDARSRSGLLAAWAAAWLDGRASYDEVLAQVTGEDEPHHVGGLDEDDVPLGWLLTELRRRGTRAIQVVLPAPGDPRGLPAGTEFAVAAGAAGEAVVADSGLGLVPEISVHGSAIGSRTVLVRWQAYEVAQTPPDPLPVAEAEYDLAESIRDTATALSSLDVASWSPQIAGALAAMRSGRNSSPAMPPGHDARALRLLAQTERLRTVLSLADADAPGGSVTAAEAQARAEVLRPLATAVRRAAMAAYNAANASRLS